MLIFALDDRLFFQRKIWSNQDILADFDHLYDDFKDKKVIINLTRLQSKFATVKNLVFRI